jgi:ABC-type sugar transport system ATPase subunit
MASVSLEGVSRVYRDVVALDAIDLQIEDGARMMLVGPSGCGKTTVLRLIAGLERPDAGTIRFDGRDMEGVAPGERNVAMVFESYALFPHMAVRENLTFALRLRHTPPAEVDRRVMDVAGAMELGHLLRRRPPGLATGEAQHVAVGRAIIRDAPDVLLLDDALSHLDARQRLEARAEVARLHEQLGSTIVAVTHDQSEALAVGTRVAVMDGGRLRQTGTPQEVYEQPADTFVAAFIGNPPMNLVEMEPRRQDGRAVIQRGSWALDLPRLPAGAGASMDAGVASITVGMRAEDIELGLPSSEAETGFRGRCDLVEYLGAHLLVHVRVGDHEIVLLADPAADVSVGDVVDGRVRLDHLHLFDTASGRAYAERAWA